MKTGQVLIKFFFFTLFILFRNNFSRDFVENKISCDEGLSRVESAEDFSNQKNTLNSKLQTTVRF